VLFNEGRIVDADCSGADGQRGFQHVTEIAGGTFEFQKSAKQFPIMIKAASNTNLILDSLRHLDENKQ